MTVDPRVPLSEREHAATRYVEDSGCGLDELGDTPHHPPSGAPCCRGLILPAEIGGKGPLRTSECTTWHGRPICRVVGDAFVLLPKWPVSLKIAHQTQIQIHLYPPSYPPPVSSPSDIDHRDEELVWATLRTSNYGAPSYPKHMVHPQLPFSCGFHPFKLLKWTPRPRC